ncbi:MAG: hypothetical protein UT02_C0018G0011 [Parcubacteria group bacterium GW2011_GWC2_38_7]|nr:MAG: hypothetical protein UT02_C0018G0011 [Parcubacteria group bacterium GW2011_GWC2_38_7]
MGSPITQAKHEDLLRLMQGLPRSQAKPVQRKTASFDDGLAQKSCEACTTQNSFV